MKKYDVLIIGSGPAGMNAAIYASRLGMETAIIEKGAPGGKLVYISTIENWIGEEHITGFNLALKMDKHAKTAGTQSVYGEVTKIHEKENEVELASGEKVGYKFLIIASGTSEIVPTDIKGIHEYNHKGVSYCAICEGPLYKGKTVAVIGGGNSAMEEAVYLSTVTKEVHIFVRDGIIAEKKILKDIERRNNIVIHDDHVITEIQGDGKVEKIITTDGDFEVSAIFPYIGLKANTPFLEGTSIKHDKGFIVVDDLMQTSVENIYGAGDVVVKHIRQISTAVADGTIAAKTIGNKI